MAFHLVFDFGDRKSPLGFLAIDATVGRSLDGKLGVNRHDDVMLVQWLLVRALKSTDYLGKPLVPDGVYGATTDYLLCRYLINKRRNRETRNTVLEPFEFTASAAQGVAQGAVAFANVLSLGTVSVSPRPGNDLEGLGAQIKEADFPSLLHSMPPYLQSVLKKNVWSTVKGSKTKPFPL